MTGADHPAQRPSHVYWCEVLAYCPATAGSWPLARRLAASPEEALRWLADRAARLAGALEPLPGYGPLPTGALRRTGEPGGPAHFFRQWLSDQAGREQQRCSLAAGRAVTVSTGGPDRVAGREEHEVRYCLSARPTRVVPSDVPTGSGGRAGCPDQPAPAPVVGRCAGPVRSVPAARPSAGCGTVSGRWVGLPFAAAPARPLPAVPR